MYRLLFTIFAALIATGSFSQTNFSGSWGVKEKQLIKGPEYVNALPSKLIVEQNKDSLIIETINVDLEGKDVKSRQVIAMNGIPSTIIGATSKRKYLRSLKWSKDKNILTLTTVFYRPESDTEVDFTRLDSWTLAGDKLVIDRKSLETRSENWEIKGVFEKL